MKRRAGVVLVCVLVLVAVLVVPALAKGPANAGGKDADYLWIEMASLYIGPDYGAGSTSTTTQDGIVIDVITSSVMMVKMKYFDDVVFTDQDWCLFKFWLSEPVDITFPGDVPYVYAATEFIFIKMYYTGIGTGHYFTLQAYK